MLRTEQGTDRGGLRAKLPESQISWRQPHGSLLDPLSHWMVSLLSAWFLCPLMTVASEASPVPGQGPYTLSHTQDSVDEC